MTKTLELLQNCSDIDHLRPLLHAICLGFGTVARLDILTATQAGKRQALCFMRMGEQQQEEELMRALGAGRFGGDIVLIVELAGPDSADARVAPGSRLPLTCPAPFRDTIPRGSVNPRLASMSPYTGIVCSVG